MALTYNQWGVAQVKAQSQSKEIGAIESQYKS